MNPHDLATNLQLLCVFLLFIEYSSQLIKILKRKSVEDISMTFWGVKLTIATLQVVSLILVSTNVLSYVSQIIGILFSLIVFSTIIYYHNKNN